MARAPAFPNRRATVRNLPSPLWDIKFYPYLIEREDPTIFAVVGSFQIYVYQANTDSEAGVEQLAIYSKPQERQRPADVINSCTWCYVDDNQPLLAVTGDSGHIQLFQPLDGTLVGTLRGHGQGVVNDLSTHPKYPHIIASASIDGSIRVWDLRRISNPATSSCIVICGHSVGHREGLLTIDWHISGRYIISGGYDHRVCVWTLPDFNPNSEFWHDVSKEGRKRSTDEVRVVYYPHFISSSIHSDYVDCVMFLGDLVLSKSAKEDKIVLWAITGFRGEVEPPTEFTAVKVQEHLETRNGFMRKDDLNPDDDVFDDEHQLLNSVELYQRCLELENKNSQSFYMRFGLLKPSKLFPELHHIVTSGDHFSRVRHWDLQRFIDGHDGLVAPITKKARQQKGLARIVPKERSVSSRESSSAPTTSHIRDSSTEATSLASEQIPTGISNEQRPRDRERYPLHEPERLLKYHRESNEESDVKNFTTRGVGWSSCGRWCIVVGSHKDDSGAMVVYQRPS